ncbi:RlpA-like double-psi beta-barrel-protein domain-containing protein-containing protein [Apiospora rasikravindrae]|uniref:RlpA-like double-psi beta-barrel-protein domain-containing protein-containing protein n=1 Tax=Apiospora rasikravindrae TaxID=990691 RepID=A0ABR1SLN3_9PEZI
MPSFTNVIMTTLCAAGLAAALPLNASAAVVAPRSSSGDMTYYNPGLGSCGLTNADGDTVVALSPSQYAEHPDACGKKIVINYGGKTATATVVDKCPGCNTDSIDVSPSVFQSLESLDAGRVQVSWSFE